MSASSLMSWTSASRSCFAERSSECSSSKLRSKWSSMARLPRPVMMRMSVSPAATASSTTYWIDGLSTTGSISFGWLFVAGKNRVPSPAAGMTAFFSSLRFDVLSCEVPTTPRRYPSARGPLVAAVGRLVALRRGIESELLTLHQSAQVRQVSSDHEQCDDRDHDDVTRFVPGERDCDRKHDCDRHR